MKIGTEYWDSPPILAIRIDGVFDNTAYHKLSVVIEDEQKKLGTEIKSLNYLVDLNNVITTEKLVRNKITQLINANKCLISIGKIAIVANSPLIRVNSRVMAKSLPETSVKIFYEEKPAMDWLKIS